MSATALWLVAVLALPAPPDEGLREAEPEETSPAPSAEPSPSPEAVPGPAPSRESMAAEAPAAVEEAGRAPASEAPAMRAPLAQALDLVDGGEYEKAVTALRALEGGLRLYEVIARDQALGVSLAFLERTEEAQAAFEHLLAVDPGWAVPYTLSPKATFVFEKARQRMAERTPLRVDPRPPVTLAYDEPIEVPLIVQGGAELGLDEVELCVRRRDEASSWRCQRTGLKAGQGTIALEAVPAPEEPAEGEDAVTVLLLAVAGYDDAANEIYRGPTRVRPLELVVGTSTPLPWYASPWLWGGVAGGAAAVAAVAVAAGATAGLLLLVPETARMSVVVE